MQVPAAKAGAHLRHLIAESNVPIAAGNNNEQEVRWRARWCRHVLMSIPPSRMFSDISHVWFQI